MKAYMAQVLIIDHDEVGADGIKTVIENARYPNRCIMPRVVRTDEAEIGEWYDQHPLNFEDADLRPYFPEVRQRDDV